MPGIKFALGENPKDMRFGGGGQQQQQPPRRYPATRLGVEFVIRDAFTRAKAYQRDWQDYERGARPRAKTCWRRAAICSSIRWSRFSKASASCTPTAIAPTRS